jgi:hypothetical protein
MIWLVRFGAVMHSIKSTQLQIINETFLVISYINTKKKKKKHGNSLRSCLIVLLENLTRLNYARK